MPGRVSRLLAGAAVIGALLAQTTPPAGADPTVGDPAPTPSAASLTLPLQDAGGPKSLPFSIFQDTASATVTFTVPAGLDPVALRATLELPVELKFGSITATQDDRVLGRTELPVRTASPVVIPLDGVQAYGNWAAVTLTMVAVAREEYCWSDDWPVRLTELSAAFTGTAAPPRNVADFLPPVLRRLTIAIPAQPTLPESGAAVQLAAAMALRYAALSPRIDVVALGGPPPPGAPLERRIELREGPDKGLTVLTGRPLPTLAISGAGDELTHQSRLLGDPSLRFATGAKAVAGAVQKPPPPLGDGVSLAGLEVPERVVSAVEPRLDLDVDQTQFGRPVSGVRVHLLGSHTPLPDNLGGELTVSTGGRTLARWAAEPGGAIDRRVDIPDDLLRRTTTLRVAMDITGDTGQCGQFRPMTLRIDPETEIAVDSAETPLPPGLQSLPQALMPRFQVGLGDAGFADTVRAATIAAGLQQSSAVPLTLTVTDLRQALAAREPAVLIAADGWTDAEIALPFTAAQGSVTVEGYQIDGTPSSIAVDAGAAAGSLQTVIDGRRSLLVATSNNAPGQLDELLGWLDAERGRWSGVSGQAVISTPGAPPVTVPALPADPAATPTAAGVRIGQHWWIGGAVVVALALAGAVTILVRTRNS